METGWGGPAGQRSDDDPLTQSGDTGVHSNPRDHSSNELRRQKLNRTTAQTGLMGMDDLDTSLNRSSPECTHDADTVPFGLKQPARAARDD
ncbi:hypothetical protein NDU88_002186 [Pleurodeles waltl]|uniref:Uncharacterized protein n=1 Tax=Pleurodeles waltl TaxID=8319 RepID=A0AAV7VDL1_PLEWA|nr:hypothetical protein NDU88_002186 [Pleurodeles waltl]